MEHITKATTSHLRRCHIIYIRMMDIAFAVTHLPNSDPGLCDHRPGSHPRDVTSYTPLRAGELSCPSVRYTYVARAARGWGSALAEVPCEKRRDGYPKRPRWRVATTSVVARRYCFEREAAKGDNAPTSTYTGWVVIDAFAVRARRSSQRSAEAFGLVLNDMTPQTILWKTAKIRRFD